MPLPISSRKKMGKRAQGNVKINLDVGRGNAINPLPLASNRPSLSPDCTCLLVPLTIHSSRPENCSTARAEGALASAWNKAPSTWQFSQLLSARSAAKAPIHGPLECSPVLELPAQLRYPGPLFLLHNLATNRFPLLPRTQFNDKSVKSRAWIVANWAVKGKGSPRLSIDRYYRHSEMVL